MKWGLNLYPISINSIIQVSTLETSSRWTSSPKQGRLVRALFKLLWINSKEGDCTPSLGSLLHCLDLLMGKKFHWGAARASLGCYQLGCPSQRAGGWGTQTRVVTSSIKCSREWKGHNWGPTSIHPGSYLDFQSGASRDTVREETGEKSTNLSLKTMQETSSETVLERGPMMV